MACAIHQQRSFGLLKEEEWQCQSTHALTYHRLLWQHSFTHPLQCKHPNLKHTLTQESLCIHALSNPFWVAQELTSGGGLASAQNGDIPEKTEEVFHSKSSVCNGEVTTYLGLLKACAKNKDLYRGTQLHDDILKRGLFDKCSDALVTMYAKCGALVKAKELLGIHKSRNIIAWTALIAGYARQDQGGHDAWNCFEWMLHEGLSPDAVIFACLLKACGSMKAIDKGEQVHDVITKQGLLGKDIVLGTALVDMYAKCGALAKAHQVLADLPSRDVISWNALIAGFAQKGRIEPALKCFEQMQQEGLSPDTATFTCILKVCGSIGAIEKGEQIHDEITRYGLLRHNIVLGTALMDMYVKCGALAKAQEVFEELPSRDAVSWSSLIAGYAQQGQGKQALDCFEQMQCEGLSPDALTFAFVLKACGSIGAAYKGEQIHDEITRRGLLRNNNVLGTALVDMYAKCGALTKAEQVLEELPSRDVVSWTALIAGYTQQGLGDEALNCFERMQREGFSPDAVTFAYILKACSSIRASDKGEQIHDEITRLGLLGNNHVLGTALVDMYAKCGALTKARQVLEELPFRDSVSWNALIAGYAQRGHNEQALKCFEQMEHEGISPDAVTFACILNACGSKGETHKGEEIHDEIMKQGLLGNNPMLGSALVDMYAKCGALSKAQRVLEQLPSRDIISWNALIAGYVQQGQGEKALNCFEHIKREGLSPDVVTFTCILRACGIMGLANKGEQIHDEIANRGLLGSNVVLGTALVDMYAKCGALAKAQQVLEDLPSTDVVAWNALITGYTQQGQVEQVLSCLEQMQHRGLSPNAVTFSCVLNACNHLGLVDDGHIYFMSMSKKYGLKPELEHYTCMVDLYGRAGHLDKAVGVIQEIPSSNYSAVWSVLLGACWKWGDVKVGRWAFEQALQVDKSEAAAYVLMANLYAGAGMQGDAEEIEAMRMENKAWKKPRLQLVNS